MRLINYKCITCDHEQESDLLTTEQYNQIIEDVKSGKTIPLCEKCGGQLILFNYARNYRWRYMDD